MGPNCNVPVKRFQSLWSRINPWIPDSRWVIPTSLTTGFQWLNEVAMDIRFHFGLDRLITSFGVMELILLINVVVYLLWKISAVEDEWMETHFTTSFFSTINQRRLHTIITANFSHKSLPHLINNMYGLLIYGPIVYSLIGDTGFWILWGMACVMTSVASLIWKFHFRNPEHRWTRSLGASGCIVALRTAYVLLLYRGDLGSEVIRDNLLSFILIDLLLVVGPSTDFAGHIGGAMAGWLFCFIRKKGILAA